MTRYPPARHYLPAAGVALALAAFSAWCGWRWTPAFIPALILLLSSALLAFLAARPAILIRDDSWSVGEQSFLWSEVETLDATGWSSPLILRIGLRGNRVFYLIYPGEPANAGRLLRQMRRLARGARIDGVPYRQYWGENPASAPGEDGPAAPVRYRMLRSDDEAEVERLYQQLKSAGKIDHQTSEERRD